VDADRCFGTPTRLGGNFPGRLAAGRFDGQRYREKVLKSSRSCYGLPGLHDFIRLYRCDFPRRHESFKALPHVRFERPGFTFFFSAFVFGIPAFAALLVGLKRARRKLTSA
jgi:hypothetical protein